MARTTVEKYQVERGVKVERGKLHPNQWNPNKTTQRQQEAIAESLSTFGQLIEIVVRPHPTIKEEYEVIDGEHRLQELSETVYVNVIHGLSDAEAKKLTIIFNETRGEADKIELAGLLADIATEFESLDTLQVGLPYDLPELEELIKLSEFDWSNFNTDVPPSSDDEERDDGYITIVAKIPPDVNEKLRQAHNLVKV
jgi:hypothetical protein